MLKSEKTEIIKKYARHEGDTGSPEVQIAVLTKRINDLTEHLRTERKICAAEEKPLANFEELCYTFKVPVLGSGTNPFGRHLRRDNTDPDL